MLDVGLASNIMLSLKEMFGEQGHSTRQETMRQIYNTKMAEGTSMREHYLKIISNLNTLKVLSADIDGESQVDMILQSLPKSIKEFKLKYNMSKKIYLSLELMNELLTMEGILGTSSVDANIAEGLLLNLSQKARVRRRRRRTSTSKMVNKLP